MGVFRENNTCMPCGIERGDGVAIEFAPVQVGIPQFDRYFYDAAREQLENREQRLFTLCCDEINGLCLRHDNNIERIWRDPYTVKICDLIQRQWNIICVIGEGEDENIKVRFYDGTEDLEHEQEDDTLDPNDPDHQEYIDWLAQQDTEQTDEQAYSAWRLQADLDYAFLRRDLDSAFVTSSNN